MNESAKLSVEVINEVENLIGYTFNNKGLLTQAFIHSSYANENKSEQSYELLEFFGDRALDFVITEELSNKFGAVEKGRYSPLNQMTNEGTLTLIKSLIVRKESLASRIDDLGWQKYFFVGNGDDNIRESINKKEDLFESVIGAVCIDSSWNHNIIKNVVMKMIGNENIVQLINDKIEDQKKIQVLSDWYLAHFKKPVIASVEYDRTDYYLDGNQVFECSIYLKNGDSSWSQTKNGSSKEEALRNLLLTMYYDIIVGFARYDLFPEDAYIDCPKKLLECNDETAINVVQELEQKGMIHDVSYSFIEMGHDENGNPIWSCSAKYSYILDTVEHGTCTCTSSGGSNKTEVKKRAALGLCHSIKETFYKISE